MHRQEAESLLESVEMPHLIPFGIILTTPKSFQHSVVSVSSCLALSAFHKAQLSISFFYIFSQLGSLWAQTQ